MTQDQQLHIDSEILEATIEETANTGPGRGHIVDVTLIRAGTSSNGNHYPEQVLQDATVLFEGARAFADHKGPTDRAERSVRDLVGYYRQPRYELTPDGGRIRATFHLLPGNDWLWGIIQEATVEPKDLRAVDRRAGRDQAVGGPGTSGADGGERSQGQERRYRDAAGRRRKPRRDHRQSESDHASDVSSTADSDVFNADERKQFATVTRHHEGGSTEYKFPHPAKSLCAT